ncbi:MAG: HD domain-containing protein [Deltaproteobacteria bacterium]|nr:HD domain-containing protein [Deltaproteobacteria bacterium]
MNNSYDIHSTNVTSSIENLIRGSQIISALVNIAHNQNYELYLVGGFLRDTLLGRSCKDVDFVSSRSAELSKLVARQTGSKAVLIDRKFGTVRLIPLVGADILGEDFVVDLSPMRGSSILDDLCQRDFTINSLALDISSWWTERKTHLLDPLGGIADLEESRLRSCSQRSLSDDPLRILRAYRLVSAYGLILDAQIRKKILQERHGLNEVAVERIRDELMLIFEATSSGSILRMLDEDGILTLLLPECVDMRNLPQNDSQLPDVWQHSLSTLEALEFFLLNIEELLGKYGVEAVAIITQELAGKRSRQIALKLGVLLHEMGKPQRKSVGRNGAFHFYGHQVAGSKLAVSLCSRLCLSNKEINFVSQLVRQHMRPQHLFNQTHPSARALSLFFKLGPEIFWPLLLLFAADYMASQKSTTGEVDLQPLRQRIIGWLDFYYEQLKPREMEPSIVSGHDIMKYLHLSPGPMVGKLLKTLTELQWEGRISTRKEALHQAARLLKDWTNWSEET